jgi:hypothetical protein
VNCNGGALSAKPFEIPRSPCHLRRRLRIINHGITK